MRRFVFAAAAAVALAGPAFAGVERCQEPFGPVLPSAATITQEGLKAARLEVKRFIDESDSYQECLLTVMRDPSEKLTDAQKAAIDRRIAANQKEKEAIGAAYNELVKAYNAKSGK